MKIRRYLGKDTQEAILKVKMDLGNDAVILNTRKVRQKGLLKLFSKPMVEILAAVDEEYGHKKEKEKQDAKGVQAAGEYRGKSRSEEKEQKFAELENKVNCMETLLHEIYGRVQNNQTGTAEEAALRPDSDAKVLQRFYENLIRNEVDAEVAKKITDAAAEKLGESASVQETASVLQQMIGGILGKPATMKLREDGKPTVVIFLGPTGVGKTTTLAKIAASYALNYKKSVGLITADTYRIAAVEQLKTYAEILGMPVSVIYSPQEIRDAVRSHADKEIILVDTAGRSYKNRAQFEELKALVTATEADETYLVLSATTSTRACRDILSHYGFLRDYKLIFTKLDETSTNGIILNARYLSNKSISYMTNGQSVPDDIEMVNVDKITKNLLGSVG